MVVTEDEVVEKVGNYEFTVRFGEDTPESRRRWERRSEALAAWLYAQWQSQQLDYVNN
jgi:hypothetical protein